MDSGRRQEKTAMKIIVDSATDKVLGVSMVGPDAAEIMQVTYLFSVLVAYCSPVCIDLNGGKYCS